MRKLILFLLCSIFIFTGCSLDKSEDKISTNQENINTSDEKSTTEESDLSEIKTGNNSSKEDKESSDEHVEDNIEEISEEVKDYIINGQGDKPEAMKLKWSKTFLIELDITSLYSNYISDGGDPDDIEALAKYITLNAEPMENWQQLFEKDLYEDYGEKVVRLEQLEEDLYQAYIEKDGKEIPYVVVSSRTGYFHG